MPPSSVSVFPGAAQPQADRSRPVVAYDFRRPTKLSRDHVRSLQQAYETFARRLTTVLTSTLRQVCHVSIRDITQQSYDEYIGMLATPTLLVPVEVTPLGAGALEISLPAALAAIDHMLGGPGGTQPARGLTDIETSLVRRLIDQIFGVLGYALEPVVPVQFEVGAIEYNPQFLQIATAADAVVIGEFDLVIGRESCTMTVCLPLAPLLPRLMTQRPREVAPTEYDAGAAGHLRDELLDMSAEVRVRFMPVGDRLRDRAHPVRRRHRPPRPPRRRPAHRPGRYVARRPSNCRQVGHPPGRPRHRFPRRPRQGAPLTTTVATSAAELLERAGVAAARTLPLSEQLNPVADPGSADLAGAVIVPFTGSVTGELALIVDEQTIAGTAPGVVESQGLAAALAPVIDAVVSAMGNVHGGVPQTVDPRLATSRATGYPDSASIGLAGAGGLRAVIAIGLTPSAEPAAQSLGRGAPLSADRLDLLRGVEMQASAELGRARMTINDLLSLRTGAVIELDRAAGDPADLFVNGRLIARGEVVVVDENYALRITQIVTDEIDR